MLLWPFEYFIGTNIGYSSNVREKGGSTSLTILFSNHLSLTSDLWRNKTNQKKTKLLTSPSNHIKPIKSMATVVPTFDAFFFQLGCLLSQIGLPYEFSWNHPRHFAKARAQSLSVKRGHCGRSIYWRTRPFPRVKTYNFKYGCNTMSLPFIKCHMNAIVNA